MLNASDFEMGKLQPRWEKAERYSDHLDTLTLTESSEIHSKAPNKLVEETLEPLTTVYNE